MKNREAQEAFLAEVSKRGFRIAIGYLLRSRPCHFLMLFISLTGCKRWVHKELLTCKLSVDMRKYLIILDDRSIYLMP
jgi:hypothetical protein